MNRLALWRRLFLTLAFGVAASITCRAPAQSPAITTDAQGLVTIDASRLTSVVALDMPWRFSPTDDPSYASPAFVDSAWPLLSPGKSRLLADAHIPNASTGRDWVRLHLHILNANDPLAITLTSVRNATPYAVFANGIQMGQSKGFGTAAMYQSPGLLVALPRTTDVVLAIHFVSSRGEAIHYFPLELVEIGQGKVLREHIGLDRYKSFEEAHLAVIVIAMLYLIAVPFSLVLWVAQRDQSEYIWFALFCTFAGILLLDNSMQSAGWIPMSNWVDNVFEFADSGTEIACIGFVAALAGTRRLRLIRAFQAFVLISPMLISFNQIAAGEVSGFLDNFLWLVLVTIILFKGYRRGKIECGLLFFPLVCLPLSFFITQAKVYFPALFGKNWQGHIGGLGITQNDLTWLPVLAGLIAVVLYRFIRISKDEQLAASELEAARTVQQLLIPATQPATPGFTVESVYLPARQVGGDFFLVLPAFEPSQDQSILAIMGDVSGKGLQAAMIVSTIIGGLRMQLSRQPAEVLTHLNRLLVGHVSGFATCCAALIHPDGRMQFANAGNPSPYYDGEELETLPGLPLGLTSEATYEETEHRLAPLKPLTFVSDGVIEATTAKTRNQTNELFGFDRTREISTHSATFIANEACRFGTGAPQADDITVLTIQLA